MARTKTETRSQTARARARQAMADELERARKRETKLVAVFSAIDAREEAEASLGKALIELQELGAAQADLAEMTGLSAREVGAAIRSAKDHLDTTTDTSDERSASAASDDNSQTDEHHSDNNGAHSN